MKGDASLHTGPDLPVPFMLPRSHFADLMELTKPRIAVLVLFTVAAGAFLAQPEAPDLLLVFNTVLGTALLAAGASVLNQVLEKHSDALMRRTENRPLPSGRLHPVEATLLGLGLSIGGLLYLALTSRYPLPVWLGFFTLVGYVFVYTPLKRYTKLNTVIGAIPGALPPVIGWTAMTGSFDAGVVGLFLVLFLWQVPHFLAIAWIYREDYGRAGLKMVPVDDPAGKSTSIQMVLFCVILLVASLLAVFQGHAGVIFAIGAVGFGAHFLRSTLRFARDPGMSRARQVLYASLLYLPGVLGLWLVDHWLRLGIAN